MCLGSCGQPGASHSAHDVCTESEVKAIATEMQSNGMRAAGYQYIMLDDCWAAVQRTPGGELAAVRRRFPSGNGSLAELAMWLHARQFLLGAYTAAGNETCSTGGRSIPGEPGARGVPGGCDGVTPEICLPQYQRDGPRLPAKRKGGGRRCHGDALGTTRAIRCDRVCARACARARVCVSERE